MYKVIVPILNPNMAEDMVHLAGALSGLPSQPKPVKVKITVLGVVTVPEETPLSQGASLVKAYRTMLHFIPPEDNAAIEVTTEVRVAREVWQGVDEQVREEGADLVLLHWKGTTQTPGAIYGSTIDALMRELPCDIVLARLNELTPVRNILIPVRGNGYSSLALRLAARMSESWGATITVLHSLPQQLGTAEPAPDTSASSVIPDPTRFTFGPAFGDPFGTDDNYILPNLLNELPPGARLITLQGEATASIVREAAFSDLVVVGASATEGVSTDPTADNESMVIRLARQIGGPLLVVKTHQSPELGKPAAPHAEDDRLSETVDRWFAQNTFHYREFRGMSSLTLLKEQNNLSVSLIIPVYGQIPLAGLAENVRRTRFALMRDCALVDEIIISACNMPFSPKETALFIPNEEAKADITIIHSESPVPGRLGNGPGEALWQAMRKVRGDIVVWADPGASTFEARFIYGLIGPLLNYPKFMMACGFFSEGDEPETRPVLDNLTEISIRPLLGGFFPRLAGFINPIGLVGAARREHLERIPFFTESGFMTGLIIDTLARKGLLSMVQIDLGAATPRVSELTPQRVTAEIVSVLLRRIEERTQTHLVNLLNPSVKTVQKANGVFSLKVTPSTPLSRELPPPLYTPGYYRNSF